MAAKVNDTQKIEALIKEDADVNKANNKDTTALFIAAQNGHLNIVKLLLDNVKCGVWNH